MIRINLLPTEAALRKESAISQLFLGGIILAGAFVLLFLTHAGKKRQITSVDARNSKLQLEIN